MRTFRVGDKVKVRESYSRRFGGLTGVVVGVNNEGYIQEVRVSLVPTYDPLTHAPVRFTEHELEGVDFMRSRASGRPGENQKRRWPLGERSQS